MCGESGFSLNGKHESHFIQINQQRFFAYPTLLLLRRKLRDGQRVKEQHIEREVHKELEVQHLDKTT